MQKSPSSNVIDCADSSAVTSNILRWLSNTAFTRPTGVSGTGGSGAGDAATAVNDDPAGFELTGAGGGGVDLVGVPLEPEGVRGSLATPDSSAVSR